MQQPFGSGLHRVPLRRLLQPLSEYTQGHVDRYFVPLFVEKAKPFRCPHRRHFTRNRRVDVQIIVWIKLIDGRLQGRFCDSQTVL